MFQPGYSIYFSTFQARQTLEVAGRAVAPGPTWVEMTVLDHEDGITKKEYQANIFWKNIGILTFQEKISNDTSKKEVLFQMIFLFS